MLFGIELVDVIDEQVLRGESSQVHNQRPRSAVHVTFEVEERATQRVDEGPGLIGDTASFACGPGKFLPGVAPVAIQQGKHVARTIRNRL